MLKILFGSSTFCRLAQVNSVIRCDKRAGILVGFSLRRNVNYEPNVNEDLDRKHRQILERFNITQEDCRNYPAILKIHPQTVEHHGLVLLEGGFKKLTAYLIVNYFKIVKKEIKLLKLYEYIKPESSVVESFLHCLENPPLLDELVLKIPDENTLKYVDVYNKVLRSFLVWRLETNENEIERIIKIYPRIKHRSLKYVSWSLDILEHDLHFSKERILRHGYLIHSYPHNTLDTLKRVPCLFGKDIKEVLQQTPKIIMTATHTLLAIVKHLKDHGIPDEAVQRCFEVFTLGSKSMKKRLQQLQTVPEFKVFANNRRVLEIVHYQRKVSARLDRLKSLQRQCASLHVLISKEAAFERYTREGLDRPRGSDIVAFLAKEFDAQETEIRNYLSRHPFWCSVSSTSVLETFEFLLRKEFEKADIFRNIHLLFYPRELVKQVLLEIPNSKAVIEAQNLIKISRPDMKVELTRKKELALCLYILEKNHHFTGNGIWNTS